MKNYTKALYVVDMVNGFVREGIMHDEYIAHTIEEQVNLIKKFKKEKQAVALIKEAHEENCTEFKTFPKHCVIGTNEAELIDELKEYENDSLVYKKNSTSAIFAPGLLDDVSKMKNLKEVVGVGCCTDICVINFVVPLKNYFNQVNRDVKIIVVESATETYDSSNHNRDEYNNIAYKLIKQSGINVVKDLKQLEEIEKKLCLNKGGR